MLQPIITVIHVLSAVGLIGLVLLQHGRGADAGAAFGSGSAGTVFGARGPASFLTRTTAVLAAVFFVTSLSLAYLSSQRVERRSVVESVTAPAGREGAAPADVPAGQVPPAGAAGPGAPADVPSLGESPAGGGAAGDAGAGSGPGG